MSLPRQISRLCIGRKNETGVEIGLEKKNGSLVGSGRSGAGSGVRSAAVQSIRTPTFSWLALASIRPTSPYDNDIKWNH
jgi:hypothetical protein